MDYQTDASFLTLFKKNKTFVKKSSLFYKHFWIFWKLLKKNIDSPVSFHVEG